MRVLGIIHGQEVRAGVFADPIAERGHELDEWSIAHSSAPPRPPESYDAVLVFGGSMHADQEEAHSWLRDETALIKRFLDAGTPLLGVCLGGQLLAKAAGAWVGRATEPEIGWSPLELTAAASSDPLFAGLPHRFEAFQWHYYAYEVPAGASELARNRVCSQAFRLGETAWAVQFHPEVTLAMVEAWLAEDEEVPGGKDALRRKTREQIDEWNALGRELCASFLGVAERLRLAA